MLKKIQEEITKITECEETARRVKELFKYKAFDEDGYQDDNHRNLFIEIGGPCVHVSIAGLTRCEIESLRQTFDSIIQVRKTCSEIKLNVLCRELLGCDNEIKS